MHQTVSSNNFLTVVAVAILLWLNHSSGFAQTMAVQASGPNSDQQAISFQNCPHIPGKQALYNAQCATLAVGENPYDSFSKQINLNVMRLPAIQDRQLPPVFFIAGGPGQASTDIAPLIRQQFSSLLKNHDFVFVDQRGTGQSNPLNCRSDALETQSKPPAEAAEKANQSLQQCIDEYDADLSFYTTPFAVNDLEKVRKALGYASINLWGVSYGTRVILEYLRQFPDAINRAVMDGAAPVSIELPVHATSDASQSLAKVFNNCQQQPQCSRHFIDQQSRWQGVLIALRERPQTITLNHPRTGQETTLYIDDVVISRWVRLSLYVRDLAILIPLAIDRAIEGDFAILYSMQAIGLDSISSGISEGMQFNILCAEDNQFRLHQQSHSDSAPLSLLSSIDIEIFDASCKMISSRISDPDYFKPLHSKVPVLLLSGELDPATPPRWAELTQKELSQSQHIIVPGGHHNVSGLGCIPQLITEFLQAATPTDMDATCASQILPENYFIDNAGPALMSKPLAKPEVGSD